MGEPKKPKFHFETSGIHAGLTRSENGVRDAPIYASTSFVFNNSAHGAAIFGMEAEAFCYSRIANPTVDVFEKRMASLENGAAALAASSGQAALFMTITALAQAGSNIVVASQVSDATEHQLRYRLQPLGITAKFVESGDIQNVKGAVDENTKGVFVESISSRDLVVSDIESLAGVAHECGVPLIVENTAGAGGYFLRPIDHGADIIVESAAEWLSISGSASAGIIIDSGKFDWVKNQHRFPQFFEKAPGFHGLKLWEKFGNLVFISFARIAVLRDMGPCLNPFEAFQLLAGLETLSVRVEKNSSKAASLAAWFESNPYIKELQYPGLITGSSRELNVKYLENGYGGVLSFKMKDGKGISDGLLQRFRVASVGQSVGGSKTKIIQTQGNTGDDLPIYISAGLENIDDIIADFEQAFSGV